MSRTALDPHAPQGGPRSGEGCLSRHFTVWLALKCADGKSRPQEGWFSDKRTGRLKEAAALHPCRPQEALALTGFLEPGPSSPAPTKARPAGASGGWGRTFPLHSITPQALGAGLLRVRAAAPRTTVLTLIRSSRSAYQAARPIMEG